MSEREMADPQKYRGGVEEPEGAKGGAPGGLVPRELVDEPVSPPSDEQELGGESLGGFAKEEPTEQVPRDAGDDADATTDGGPDQSSPSRVGAGSVPEGGRVGKVKTNE